MQGKHKTLRGLVTMAVVAQCCRKKWFMVKDDSSTAAPNERIGHGQQTFGEGSFPGHS